MATNVKITYPAKAEVVRGAIEQLNYDYHRFCEVELPALIGSENGLLTPEQWFKANSIIANRGFKAERMEFMRDARLNGGDVKINMQSLELLFCGKIE